MPTSTLHDAVSRRAPEPPAATALHYEGEHVTYGQSCAEIDAFAGEINRLLPDRTRPLCAPLRKTPEAIAPLLALFREGGQVLLASAGLAGLGELGGLGEQILHEPARRAHCSHLISLASADRADGTPSPAVSGVPPGPPGTTAPPRAGGRLSLPLEFDGSADSSHHPYRNGEAAAHMEFLKHHGDFADLPHDFVMENMRPSYPRFPEGAGAVSGGSLAKEAGSST